jgi:hypothetical protein
MPGEPWPDSFMVAGDVLVKGVRERSHLNACIGTQLDDQTGLFWYADGYKQAARRLVDEFISEGQTADFTLDTVVYPIVFLYRHHFELLLKLLLREGDLAEGGEGNVPMGHGLGVLWSKCRARVEPMFKTADWSQNDLVDELIKQFDAVDPNGETARYPHSVKGNKSFDGNSLLNIEHFAEVADRLSLYLETIGQAIDAKGAY